jgi:uncharacterized circularly permuted ATP-grasp superfamily protein
MNEVSSQDPWPPGVGPQAWAQITAGLLQRTRLLEAMAQQVYAPGQSPHTALPSALTLGHGAYLPQLHRLAPPGGRWLGLMTFDIAPDANGLWWVLGQCSRASWPEPVSTRPRHPSGPLTQWLQRWQSVAPAAPDVSPLWVALLPATADPLATGEQPVWREWGLQPARADQLQVRQGRLWWHHDTGLRPVQGMINLQGDDVLDPLEQTCDPHLGIAGLFGVLRHGQLVLLNAPGLVFLDTPAWLGFLPALTQSLLLEPLRMPSITSWWCGEPSVARLALERGHDHWIVPTYPDDGLRPHFNPQSVDALSDVQRSAWEQRMREDGAAYTVQSRWHGAAPWRVLTLIDPDGGGSALTLGPTDAWPQPAPWI